MSKNKSTDKEQTFETRLLAALCSKLIELGEIQAQKDFLEKYPKENLADVHNNETGAYYLMTGEKPVKLVEYNLITLEIFDV